jgi:hypothetical protein
MPASSLTWFRRPAMMTEQVSNESGIEHIEQEDAESRLSGRRAFVKRDSTPTGARRSVGAAVARKEISGHAQDRFVVACAVAPVFGGLSSAAFAITSGWMVNKSQLTGSKALATTAAVTRSFQFAFAGLEINCGGSNLNSSTAEIKAPNKGAAASITFTGCESQTHGCVLSSTEISTAAPLIRSDLSGHLSGEDHALPEAKTLFPLFALFEYVHEPSCPLKERIVVTGHATLLAPIGQDEKTSQEISLRAEGEELVVGGTSFAAEGSALFKLASGESWSFL